MSWREIGCSVAWPVSTIVQVGGERTPPLLRPPTIAYNHTILSFLWHQRQSACWLDEQLMRFSNVSVDLVQCRFSEEIFADTVQYSHPVCFMELHFNPLMHPNGRNNSQLVDWLMSWREIGCCVVWPVPPLGQVGRKQIIPLFLPPTISHNHTILSFLWHQRQSAR